MYNDLLARPTRPVLPYRIDEVLIDRLVFTTLLLDLLGQLPGVGACYYAGIHSDDLASLDSVHCPFLDGWDVLDTLLQQLPVAVQLLLSLVEVATIGGQGSLVVRNHCVASRASEAADVCWRVSIGVLRETAGVLTSTGVARGYVLALVAVFGRDHCMCVSELSALLDRGLLL